ncbi:hydroxymethylbilane synthase [Taibaiella soli]|uniref:Hydroxymethylbilane synthase n=1 Tax=Taibaiella soli TaxID=1649169 RepID=A0A2W2ASY9_9BACT|nr:hydroxymethylbilane synthase [Taibaiella soli]PZF70808.1 hydroxymethylbilane synthase [Taibaiella soli]
MNKTIKIGTRESQLAVWQATQVQNLLAKHGYAAELVYIKSEGDIDLQTPLYEIGVQGIFTKALDIALLKGDIDIAVHSMKDVPTQLAKGIRNAAVLPRASWKDILVVNGEWSMVNGELANVNSEMIIATSSTRRRAQWLNRYPKHSIDNLRGNVNTRLRKVAESNWQGAIFAAAGLERINLRPENSVDLDWMLPAPAQGAIMVVCREEDSYSYAGCQLFHDFDTALCTHIERDFLRGLMGGCTTPISALATIKDGAIHFSGNLLNLDGSKKVSIEKVIAPEKAFTAGAELAREIIENGGKEILEEIKNA